MVTLANNLRTRLNQDSMKTYCTLPGIVLALALGGCETGGGRGIIIRDPAGDYRNATYEVERLRRDLVGSKPEDPFHDMNQRQLNRALERQDNAVEERFRILEQKAGEPPPSPSPPPMRWTVLKAGGALGFAVSPGHVPTDGVWTNWAEQGGRKLLQFEIVDGLKEGKDVSYYPTGKKKTEYLFRKGKRHGPSSSWRPNGKKAWERHYKNGAPHGTWTEWDEQGQETNSRTYKDGQLVVETE